jgi:hypothetical protein
MLSFGFLVRPVGKISGVCLLHDNFWPHTSVRTALTVTNFGWTVFLPPAYSSDHVSWEFNFSGSLKDSLQGQLYGVDEALQNMVRQWLQEKESNFARAANTCRCSNVEHCRDEYHAVLKNKCAFSIVVVKLYVVCNRKEKTLFSD